MSPISASERLSHRLINWKRQLIDLTRRNRLLNYRPTKTTTVEIVDEVPQQIIRQLLAGEVFEFDAKPERGNREHDRDDEHGQSDADRRSFEIGRTLDHPTSNELEEHHRDDRLQTTLTGSSLENNLIAIYRRASESLEEQGVSTLFLALGMLEWHEADESNVVSKAPLIMVPVELTRETAASPFVLRMGDEDPILNAAIVEKLRLDFQIRLPDLPEFSDDLDIDQVFQNIRQAVAGFARWRLTADVVLGLFSFQKFIMYRDIERNDDRFREHPVIRAICRDGDQPGYTGLPPDIANATLDEEMSPWASVQVLDADSSQQRAMLAAKKGHNLVIEGPPGTGKSQTITNLIADALHDGKTVLFVSEKMAALEVVKSRLEHGAGLGDYVLELHGNKVSKREFVEEISRSLDRVETVNGNHEEELRRLQTLTGELRDYVVQLHEPFEPLGMSPYQAIGALAEVEDQPRVEAGLPGLQGTSKEQFTSATALLDDLSRALRDVGAPKLHPLRGFGLEFAGRGESSRVEKAVEEAGRTLADLTDAAYELADLLGLRQPRTFGEAQVMVEGARVVAASPGAEPTVLGNPRWNELSAEVQDLLATGRRCQDRRPEVEKRFRIDVLDHDASGWIAEYEQHLRRGIWRIGHPAYWRIRKRLRAFLSPTYKPDGAEGLLKDARLAQACREDRLQVEAVHEVGRDLFGGRWNGPESDWDDLERFAAWVVEFRRYALKELLGAQGIDLVAEGKVDRDESDRAIRNLDQAIQGARKKIQELIEVGSLSEESAVSADAGASIGGVSGRIAEIEASLDQLRPYSAFVAARNACADGLTSEYVTAALEKEIEQDRITPAFRRLFFERWLDQVFANRPVLGRFRSARHEERINEFRELDLESLDIAEHRTRAALNGKRQALLAPELQGQLQILQREARKRTRILPVRKLLKRVADAIQRVKPCFMMSPLSVAQFLDPEVMHFDLIVFDEASQIPPADAIGAIIRADQVVVVGDSKQLPPTNFFGVHLDVADTEEDEEVEMLEDLESILDEVAVAGIPSVRLKWHYRSEHQSLIRFSNEEFYSDDPLYVFPSAVRGDADIGLTFEYVENGVYEGKGQNQVEACRVAEAVVEHIRSHPDLSLGVGTFGIAQQSRIMDELDRIRRENPSIEWFFSREGGQKFFVKNLENIQGDDRDVIFLSVTYGPNADGIVRRNFGPINKQGGWRRLNVLTTRAKRLLRIFSSMRADQIDTTDVNQGAVLLRQYLKYAETGEYPSAKIPKGAPDSPFEVAVLRALERRGYRVVPQVGDAGYRIDIGVVDDEAPGRYICGIECDGATYHGAATVRDRDRLRQQVLELRGWDIHRVWSTDWFHDPRGQIERLVRLIEGSREQARRPKTIEVTAEPEAPAGPEEVVEPRDPEPKRVPLEDIEVPLYQFAPIRRVGEADAFYTSPVSDVAEMARAVIEVEGPIHLNELARRVAGFWSMQRAGSQIVRRIELATDRLARSGIVVREEEFFWLASVQVVPVRSRAVDGASFSSDLIAPIEVTEAIRLLLRHRAPILPDDLVVETARLLGFARTGQKLRERVEQARSRLTENGELRVGGRGLHLVEVV